MCSGRCRSCGELETFLLNQEEPDPSSHMEFSPKERSARGRKNEAEKAGLQALAEVAHKIARTEEGFPLSPLVTPRTAQTLSAKSRMGKAAKSGHAKRLEPESSRLVETNEQVSKRFAEAGWLNCIRKFQGHDIEATYHFILSLNGSSVTVKGVSFRVTEDSIAEAIEVPRGGEAWFKNAAVTEIDMNKFVRPKFRNTKWAAGFPREYLTEEWNSVERITRQYFTCEGRYT